MYHEIQTGHTAFVHDVCPDPTGTFIATCSSDKTIRVYNRRRLKVSGDRNNHHHYRLSAAASPCTSQQQEQSTWVLCVTLASDASTSIVRLAWAHRSFGHVLAAASSKLLLYRISILPSAASSTTGAAAAADTTGNNHDDRYYNNNVVVHADRMAVIGFEKDVLNDIAFGPRQFGFVYATASSDGYVRLYDDKKDIARYPTSSSASAAASISVSGGSNTTSSPSAHVAPPPGTSGGGVESASSSSSTHLLRQQQQQQQQQNQLLTPVTAISWCPAVCETTMLIAAGYRNGEFAMLSYAPDVKVFSKLALFSSSPLSPKGNIQYLSWAPTLGRKYYQIAMCSPQQVNVIRLKKERQQRQQVTTPRRTTTPLSATVIAPSGIGTTLTTNGVAAAAVNCNRRNRVPQALQQQHDAALQQPTVHQHQRTASYAPSGTKNLSGSPSSISPAGTEGVFSFSAEVFTIPTKDQQNTTKASWDRTGGVLSLLLSPSEDDEEEYSDSPDDDVDGTVEDVGNGASAAARHHHHHRLLLPKVALFQLKDPSDPSSWIQM